MADDRVKLTVRATPEQSRAVAIAARALGLTVNDYLLGRALDSAARDAEAARLSVRLDALEAGLAEALAAFRSDVKADLADALADALAEAGDATAAAIKEQADRTMRGLQSVVDYVQKVAGKRQAPQPKAEQKTEEANA